MPILVIALLCTIAGDILSRSRQLDSQFSTESRMQVSRQEVLFKVVVFHLVIRVGAAALDTSTARGTHLTTTEVQDLNLTVSKCSSKGVRTCRNCHPV